MLLGFFRYHKVLSVIIRYLEGFEKYFDDTVSNGDFFNTSLLWYHSISIEYHLISSWKILSKKLTILKLWSLIGRCCQVEKKITWCTCSLFYILTSLRFGWMYHQVLSISFRYHEGSERCLDDTILIGDFLVPHCLGILLLVSGIVSNHLRKNPLKTHDTKTLNLNR